MSAARAWAAGPFDLANRGCFVAGVSLFGSPRPGLRDFAGSYADTFVDGS